jgi:hypothetical protein
MQEVGGSIPPGSTNLRRFAATVGKPPTGAVFLFQRDVADKTRRGIA